MEDSRAESNYRRTSGQASQDGKGGSEGVGGWCIARGVAND